MRLLDLLARIVRWKYEADDLSPLECPECEGTGVDPDDNEGVCRACEEG